MIAAVVAAPAFALQRYETPPLAVSALALAVREGVEMPIVSMVHRVLFDGLPAHRGVTELMARELRAEQDA